mgnify:CR=1 FL=1
MAMQRLSTYKMKKGFFLLLLSIGSLLISTGAIAKNKRVVKKSKMHSKTLALKTGLGFAGVFLDAGLGVGKHLQIGVLGSSAMRQTSSTVTKDNLTKGGGYLTGYLNHRQRSSGFARVDLGRSHEHIDYSTEAESIASYNSTRITYNYTSLGLGYQWRINSTLFMDIFGAAIVHKHYIINERYVVNYYDDENGLRSDRSSRFGEDESNLDGFGQVGIGLRI